MAAERLGATNEPPPTTGCTTAAVDSQTTVICIPSCRLHCAAMQTVDPKGPALQIYVSRCAQGGTIEARPLQTAVWPIVVGGKYTLRPTVQDAPMPANCASTTDN
jgi:hypothetical protein